MSAVVEAEKTQLSAGAAANRLRARTRTLLTQEGGEPKAPVFTGDDWPKVDFAKPHYHTAPTHAYKDEELGRWATYFAQDAGLLLDPWEEWYFLQSLRRREDEKWVALECGLCVPRQNGKGPVCYTSTVILTTDGWVTMGDLQVGRYVYGSDGQPTRVVAKSPVFLGERCYELSFADGSIVTAGEDHLWPVWDTAKHNAEAYALATGTRVERQRAAKGGAWQELSTRQIAESDWNRPHPNTGRNQYRYRVRCDIVPDTPPVDLPIDPYVFGLWLGDGTHTKANLTVGVEDVEFVRDQLFAAGYELNGQHRGNAEYQPWQVGFRLGPRNNPNGIRPRLRRLGVFGNKHIPETYLTASPAQRLALLQGLMDTDGSIGGQNKSPQVEFSTSIPALAEGFHQLARSLGIRVTPKWRKTTHQDNYRFSWTPTFNPFRLPRKAEKYHPPEGQYRHQNLMAITGIHEVPSVPVQCIQVEAEDGVYLVGRTFVPTHNSILEARELIALFADDRKHPGVSARLTIHTAHEAKTAHEGFERLSVLVEGTPKLRAQLSGRPRQSEGGEVIRLRNTRRIRFRTRTSGGGRGLSSDLLIFDEAMILLQNVHEAVWPIVTAKPNPQIWYAGSAVDKNEPLMDEHGIVFARVRKRGIKGDPDLLYAEWSLPYENPDEVPPEVAADPASWAKVNPGFGDRLSERIIAVEQRSLSARGFARERLGVGDWPDPDQGNRVIGEEQWAAALAEETSRMLDPVCLSVDVSPDRARAAIGIAGKNESGKNQVEVVRRFRGTSRVIPTLLEFVKLHGRRTEIIIDGVGAAASLIPSMELEKLNVQPVTGGEHARGCGMFFDGVMGDAAQDPPLPPTLNHLGDPALNAAVAGAVKRKLGDRWAWDRVNSTIDISPLVATTLALYGFLRRRRGGAMIYGAGDFLSEASDEEAGFSETELPPLEEEDL